MKQILFIAFFLFCRFAGLAQEKETEARGTIKVQKTGQIVKVLFDDVNYRLVGIDQYGNPMDSAVVEFQMAVTIQGIFYKEQTNGSYLSPQMQQTLRKCDQSSKIFFDKIKAKTRSGIIIEMPKFYYSIGSRNDDSY